MAATIFHWGLHPWAIYAVVALSLALFHAPVPQRLFWCSFEGLVAIALLLGGGLTALRAMAVLTGLPFTLVLLGACWTIVKCLVEERRELA